MQEARSKVLLLSLQEVYSLSGLSLLAPVTPLPLSLLFWMMMQKMKLPASSSPGYR